MAKTGMNIPMTEDRNCVRHLELFITNEIGGLIVSKINHYTEQFLAWHTFSQETWKELTEKLNVFLAIIILQGIVQKPEIPMYWSKIAILQMPIFTDTSCKNCGAALCTIPCFEIHHTKSSI